MSTKLASPATTLRPRADLVPRATLVRRIAFAAVVAGTMDVPG